MDIVIMEGITGNYQNFETEQKLGSGNYVEESGVEVEIIKKWAKAQTNRDGLQGLGMKLEGKRGSRQCRKPTNLSIVIFEARSEKHLGEGVADNAVNKS